MGEYVVGVPVVEAGVILGAAGRISSGSALDAVAAGRAFQVSLLSADFSDTSRRWEA